MVSLMSQSPGSPLARLVLFMLCLAIAGAVAAGLSISLESQQSPILNTNAPTNDIVMTGGGPGRSDTPFQFEIVYLWNTQ